MAVASTVGGVISGLTGGPTSDKEMPGTLNQGWNYYFEWANKTTRLGLLRLKMRKLTDAMKKNCGVNITRKSIKATTAFIKK